MKKQLLLITLLLTTFFSFGQVPTSERDALIALYDSTDGANWTNNTNWNTVEPVSSWFGITVENISGQDHVTEIDLDHNNLLGNIPSEIGNFLNLKILYLYFNNLTGNIPSELGNISTLEKFSFWNNNLSGDVPLEIYNLTNLTAFILDNNNLTGEIPSQIGNLINLTTYSVSNNSFNGPIPSEINNLSNLIHLHLDNNNFVGSFPEIPSLTSLKYLYTYNNQFTNTLNLSDAISIIDIDISNNSFNTLDIRNGHNTNLYSGSFNAQNNPNLTCIFVDDAGYSTTNWTNIDATTTFVETQVECDALLSVSDESFESSLVLYPNPTSGILNIENNENITIKKIIILNTLGQKIINNQIENNIDISNLPNGIYYISIESINGNKASYKIIKE
jgi:Leucine-rich repeat (LRR) protein